MWLVAYHVTYRYIVQLGSYMMSTPRGHMREEKDTFQYIPLGKRLQALLKNKDLCNEVVCW